MKKINLYISPLNPNFKKKRNVVFDERFNNIDMRDEKCEYYDWWKNNIHHWKNEWAMLFAKRIADNEGIDLCKYKEIDCIFEGHIVKTFYPFRKKEYEIYNVSTGEIVKGGTEVLMWDINKHPKFPWGWNITGYHQTFYGSHMVSKTINSGPNNGKKVLVVSDSMFIPMAPVFAGSCKELVVLDARFFDKDIKFNKKDFDDVFILCFELNYRNVISYYDKYIV